MFIFSIVTRFPSSLSFPCPLQQHVVCPFNVLQTGLQLFTGYVDDDDDDDDEFI